MAGVTPKARIMSSWADGLALRRRRRAALGGEPVSGHLDQDAVLRQGDRLGHRADPDGARRRAARSRASADRAELRARGRAGRRRRALRGRRLRLAAGRQPASGLVAQGCLVLGVFQVPNKFFEQGGKVTDILEPGMGHGLERGGQPQGHRLTPLLPTAIRAAVAGTGKPGAACHRRWSRAAGSTTVPARALRGGTAR